MVEDVKLDRAWAVLLFVTLWSGCIHDMAGAYGNLAYSTDGSPAGIVGLCLCTRKCPC